MAGLIFFVFVRCSHAGQWQPLIKDDETLALTLNEVAHTYNQPAMACAVIWRDEITVKAAVGTCVYGEDKPVQVNSRFHIGSTTKSMTALLMAILVKEGKLRYDMTLAQSLPDIAMRQEYRNVSILDLLLNKAGIIAFQLEEYEDPVIYNKLWNEIPKQFPDPTRQRREITKTVLALEPIAAPGTKVIYSNVGWAIAGLIMETAADQSYEELLKSNIFEPLGMRTAKIGGWPASMSEKDQPRGHYSAQADGRTITPQTLDDEYVLPDWMNPSGGVHCSIMDFALYAQENLAGLQGKGVLLAKAEYQALHSIHETTSLSDMYVSATGDQQLTLGLGWMVIQERGSLISAADGSGGTFFARIIVFPALNVAFVGFTNCGNGSPALDNLIKKLSGFEWGSS
jgi:CubicO group peptidase (beta-lactamase class C family)